MPVRGGGVHTIALGRFLPVGFYHLTGRFKANAGVEEREGALSLGICDGAGQRINLWSVDQPNFCIQVGEVESTSYQICALQPFIALPLSMKA